MEKIKIKELEVFARHGVLPAENQLGQKFLINADMELDILRAARTDDIKKTIDYGEVCEYITDYMKDYTFNLIETVAVKLCENILVKYPLLGSCRIEIIKPWAPIGLPVSSVSVEVFKKWERAFISLGSNMGDKKAFLDGAVLSLEKEPFVRVRKISSYVTTKPYGKKDQDDFLNAAMEIETFLSPHELLDILHTVENNAGRKRTEHWGPRTLDLDILFYGDRMMDTQDLVIPHPDMENREFVLGPMEEIAPYFLHPALGKSIKKMHDELKEKKERAAGGHIKT